MTTTKCSSCELFYKIHSMHSLNCHTHFVCKSCYNLNEIIDCRLCNSPENNQVGEVREKRKIEYVYPVQGMLVHFDKVHNPMGESEFSSITNCHQRTMGWVMCTFLGIVFFFCGLALAIKTDQLGIGVILTVIGLIGMIVSVFFIFKVQTVDQYYQSKQYIDDDGDNKVIERKKILNNRLTISSVRSDDDRQQQQQIEMVGTGSKLVNK